MFNFRASCAVLAMSSLTACQSVPEWKNDSGFAFPRPVVEAMCELASRFNQIRDYDNFPRGYYVVTITMERHLSDQQDVGLNASYKTTDSGDDYFQANLGSGNSVGIGGGRVARRTSTTPVTFKLTELSVEDKRLGPSCNGPHAKDTRGTRASTGATFGLDQWFEDVMLGAPVGFPDGVETTLYLEKNAGGSLFPAWRFVRGFVNPSAVVSHRRYDQLKVELKNQPGDAAKQGGVVKVIRGKTITEVPTTSTESYRNMMQQKVIIRD
jgi:hypothetical protein